MTGSLETLKTCVRAFLASESCGHDFLHCLRVMKNANAIANANSASVDRGILSAAALVHDLCRPWERQTGRSHFCDEALALIDTQLERSDFHPEQRLKILDIVRWHDVYDPTEIPTKSFTEELRIHQDADRLDAMGAIGIARTFAFGGANGLPIYVPSENLKFDNVFVEDPAHRTSIIAHFHEKLLKLRDQMHTPKGKEIAVTRHQRMEKFLSDFFEEWQETSGDVIDSAKSAL